MRLAFALLLSLIGVASGISSAAPREAPWDGPARAGQDCHCAVQVQPTTLATRTSDREHERALPLDALGDPGFPVRAITTALERLAHRDQVTPRGAALPLRGYDATAPPTSPLA